MNALHYPDATALERRSSSGSESTPQRRYGDSFFNSVRWPAFVYTWAVVGVVLFVYLVFRAFG